LCWYVPWLQAGWFRETNPSMDALRTTRLDHLTAATAHTNTML